MAILRMKEVTKLSLKQAEEKMVELERSLLELAAEGKLEKKKSLKKAMARLRIHIHELSMKEKTKAA